MESIIFEKNNNKLTFVCSIQGNKRKATKVVRQMNKLYANCGKKFVL